jgi:hypothetical protein
MFRRRSALTKLLLTLVISLILCGIATAEFPELLSLSDNTSNDFAIVKVTPHSGLGVAFSTSLKFAPLDLNVPGDRSSSFHSPAFERAKHASAGFLPLPAVLRN